MKTFTMGHSTHTEAEFIEILKHFEVDLLVDVRSLPGSNYVPQFNKENMEKWLPDSGIDYLYMPILGGRRNKNKNIDQALISGWRNASFRNYAGYTLTPEYQKGIDELKDLIKTHTLCIMCSEAVPWRCHRLIISNTLITQGIVVEHIMNEKKTIVHQFGNYGAKPELRADGSIIYPEEKQVEVS